MRKLLLVGLVAAVAVPASAKIQDSPIGAASLCADGKYSTIAGSGGCSHHGGFVRNLTAAERTGRAAVPETASLIGNDTMGAAPVGSDGVGTMPATGGAPVLMSLLGGLVSLSAFVARKRMR